MRDIISVVTMTILLLIVNYLDNSKLTAANALLLSAVGFMYYEIRELRHIIANAVTRKVIVTVKNNPTSTGDAWS